MSWICRTLLHYVPVPAAPHPNKWICDHCAEVFPRKIAPAAVCQESGDFKVLAGRFPMTLGVTYPRWLYQVHYCTEACAEPYVTAQVELALKGDTVGTIDG